MITQYFDPITKLPRYIPFPLFLLDVDISLTAKVIYAELVGRVSLSQRNGWVDEQGRVYIIYGNATLRQTLGKSRSTIKNALRELESVGLLERQSVPGKANLLYVKLPAAGQNFDSGRKSISPRVTNDLPGSQVSDREGDSNSPPNNLNLNIDTKQEKGDMSYAYRAFGRYQNLFLTDEEYDLLQEDYPFDLNRYIEELSIYVAASNKHYSNYEAALRMWASRDRKVTAPQANVDHYEGEDSL